MLNKDTKICANCKIIKCHECDHVLMKNVITNENKLKCDKEFQILKLI